MHTNDEWKAIASLQIDPDTTTHDLLNSATELVQYAGGLIAMLAALVHEGEKIDSQNMAFALEGAEVLTKLGVQCVSHAHASVAMDRATAMRSST
ncbi:hypothetical protein [Luteibacter yeojuensis]|uniref:Uncharacterized protein n=1 Tax=Luteibacter yeojuensis TaxID=345309 RepID=A0A7X5TR97_9GAMM|nr:hypothetical protein [Luteibacter yeojuensis]NID16654.1 hypothetical protein [Luteibacter yeojuensis]